MVKYLYIQPVGNSLTNEVEMCIVDSAYYLFKGDSEDWWIDESRKSGQQRHKRIH